MLTAGPNDDTKHHLTLKLAEIPNSGNIFLCTDVSLLLHKSEQNLKRFNISPTRIQCSVEKILKII